MLTVADIKTPNPATVRQDIPLGEVVGLMQQGDCRHMPVMRGQMPVGIITDRDIRS